MLIILNCKHLKNSKCRKNSPYLPKDKSSKRNSIVIDTLPRSFINQGRLLLSQERRPEVYTTLRQNLSQNLSLNVYLSFLKIIYFPLGCLHSSFLSQMRSLLTLNPKLLVRNTVPGYLSYIHEVYINKLRFVFLLFYLFFYYRGYQPRTQKGRGKLFFLSYKYK